MGVYFRKHITVILIVVIMALIFHSPIVKAQEDTTFTFDANMIPQEVPDTLSSETINLGGDLNNVTTELDNWRTDMGDDIVEGSYVGALFSPSIFEIDYNPLSTNDWHSINTRVGRSEPYYQFPPEYTWGTEFSDPNAYDFQATFPYASERSFVSLTQIANFSNRVIMSGATEFWVKIPILASCFNFDELSPTIAIFKTTEDNVTIQNNLENGDLWYEPSFSLAYQMYPYKWAVYDNGTLYDEEITAGSIRYDLVDKEGLLPKYKGQLPDIIQPIIPEEIANNNMYSHIYATIEPNTNYLVCVSGILKSKPQIYVTQDDIHANGYFSSIQIGDIEFEDPDATSTPDYLWELTAHHGWHKILRVSADVSNPVINETLSMPIDLAFSFIFKAGRGEEGMFGSKLYFEEGDAICFYNELDTPTNDQFISVMLPFISDVDIEVELTITLLTDNIKYNPIGVLDPYDSEFVYITPYTWTSPTPISYTDYILFSVPEKIYANTITGTTFFVKTMITFTRSANVSFMFSTLSDNTRGWESNILYEPNPDITDIQIGNPSIFPDWNVWFNPRYDLTYLYKDVKDIQKATYEWDIKDAIERSPFYDYTHDGYYAYNTKTPLDLNDHIVMHYDLFRSVQLTDGIWNQYAMDSEGVGYATHFFERRVAVGKMELWVDTSNNESDLQKEWYEYGYYEQAWQLLTEGKILESFAMGFMGSIATLYNGGSALWGTITSTFNKAWEWLKGIGSFIKTSLLGFIGEILSVLKDVANGLEQVFEIALYVIALVIFMWILGWAGRLLYIGRIDI